jgi:hypothetical protein
MSPAPSSYAQPFWLIARVSAAFANLTAGLLLCMGALVFALLAWGRHCAALDDGYVQT